MSVYTALTNIASEWRAARDDARTRRIVASLPIEVQKDIGWPDAHADRSAARSRNVAWSDYQ